MGVMRVLVSLFATAAATSKDRSFLGVNLHMPEPELKTISVVLASYNEHAYVARTVESIQATTPPAVLKEIIVVDDGSEQPMADDLFNHPEVRLIIHNEHMGLIKSKTDGGNNATGDVIMFLDAHVKPTDNWYQPILQHINLNYKRVVVPVITVLDGETWKDTHSGAGAKMMFDWGLQFHWFDDGNDEVPCMSGGLFGISKKWWHESGEYDYGMQMWGGENIEQSVRTWMCGGEIYVARNSKIGHVFRKQFPYFVNNTQIELNKVRTVETWFDEFKEKFYGKVGYARAYASEAGDMSERQELRHRLRCKNFDWYVNKFKNVFISQHLLKEDEIPPSIEM